jgi:hypothetical protein
MLKIAVFAPIPSARPKVAAKVNAGDFARARTEYRSSQIIEYPDSFDHTTNTPSNDDLPSFLHGSLVALTIQELL